MMEKGKALMCKYLNEWVSLQIFFSIFMRGWKMWPAKENPCDFFILVSPHHLNFT